MEKLYILEVAFKASSNGRSGNAMAQAASKAVDEACKKNMGWNKHFAVKVIGENKMVIAMEGDADEALEAVNKELGMGNIDVICTPCRSYETFVRDVMKCSEETCRPSTRKLFPTDKPIIWNFAEFEYKDKPLETLKKEWYDEATDALPKRFTGGAMMELYKEVGAKKVHCFAVAGFEELDNLTWTLPIYVSNGHNIKYTAKEVRLI